MMFEGKHIHFSPANKKPLCSYSAKLCKQRRINGYAFCIRHILEDKSAPFKQCAHVARYNKQKCTNPIPSNENREFCNSHMQVAGMLPKKERKIKKEKEKDIPSPGEGKLKFSDRLKALLTKENSISGNEDTINSDDPYAFPDPSSESENGMLTLSSPPILKTTWNCPQKSSPEASSSESPQRCESFPKNLIPADKLKNSAPKLSKTMNRLQAKIAQNKLLDKQKKTQDSSQGSPALMQVIGCLKSDPLSPMEVSSLHSESSEAKSMPDLTKNDLMIKLEPADDYIKSEDSIVSNCESSPNPPSVTLADSHLSSGVNSCSSSDKFLSNPDKSPALSDGSSKDKSQFESLKLEKNGLLENSKVPLVLRKVHRIFKSRKKREKYVLPSGFDSSDSGSSDSESESNLLSRLSWFCGWDGFESSSLQGVKLESRSEQRSQLKSELLHSYHQLCRLHKLHKEAKEHRHLVMQPLIEAARAYPNQTTEILTRHLSASPKQKSVKKPATPAVKTCCYKHEDTPCSEYALPYTWHCKKHITYNIDQLLFEHCTAKFSDNTQCCVPVFDICHELPLCYEHAKKRDNYQKMVSEPKPKKPRKKPKPSALTRPPKRGKKKKKPNAVRPSSPFPAPPQLPPMPPASVTSSQIELPNMQFNNVSKVGGSTITVPRHAINSQIPAEITCELAELSPGAIDKSLELPLDAAELANQASKLLEEHDFTDVLNKIPDDAFNDLFVDNKNGEYMLSTEETEELERALAAVSKDVHLAKESLAKLSSSNTGPDLEELERSIEIHGGFLGAENLTSAIDDSNFPDGHIDNLNIISSSFSTSDLNSFTQALSAMAPDSLDQSTLQQPAADNTLLSNAVNLPLVNADISNPHLLNGHTELLAGLQQIPMDASFQPALLNPTSVNMGANSVPTTLDARLLSNSSLLSAVLYNLGQSTSIVSSAPQATYSVAPTSVSNITADEATLLATTSGGLNSNHWLLNSPDQVLALSQLAYQNGFLVSSQSATTPFTNTVVGKYPLLDINGELSLGAGDSLMTQANCNTDNVICSTSEQPIHNLNMNGPATSLQQPSSVKVIVQEGAS